MRLFKKISAKLTLLVLMALPALTLAQTIPSGTSVQNNLDDAALGAGYTLDPHTGTSFAAYAGRVASVFISLIGVVFVIYVIYGGFMWMTASGNQERIDKARKTIIQGIIGVVVVLSAAAIYIFIKNVLVLGTRGTI